MNETVIYPINATLLRKTDPIRITPKSKPKKVIYVSGKYRDDRGEWYTECNIREAEEVGQFIWLQGGIAIVPHLNTRLWGGLIPYEKWIEGNLEILSRCDAICMVSNWESSEGAKTELQYAISLGMPVLYHHADLLKYLKVIL